MPYYRRNLIVLCLTMFLASVSWNQVMPFLPLFLQEMGVQKGALLKWSGIIFSIQCLASIVALPYWGKLGDRFGRKPMTIRAGFFLAAIYFGMSLCQSPLQLAILRFLNGALTGFIPGSIALIATGTPKEEAPQAVATAQTATAVGQIVGPGIGGVLADIFGYRGSMQVSGSAVLFSTILVCLLVREIAHEAPSEKTSLFEDFLFSFRSPVLAAVMLAVLFNSLFMSSVTPILALHLKNLDPHAPQWLTGIIFSLPAIAFVLVARRWTRFGESSGYDRAVILGLVGAALFALGLAEIHNIWLFAAVFFALGACIAVVSPVTGAIICTRVPESFHGRAYGMQSSAGTLGGLIAPIAATQIAAQLGMPVIFIGGSGLFLAGMFSFRAMSRRWDVKSAA